MVVTPETRHTIGRTGVGIALWLGGMGLLITFVPGAEGWWFGTAAGLAALGLLSPNWRVRLVAAGLAAVWAGFAWDGYQRGQRYQEWLREEMPRVEEFLRKRGRPNPPLHPTAAD